MKLVADIWSLLDPRERRALSGTLLLGLLSAFATLGGVAAVMPFLAFLADPGHIARHPALLSVQHLLGIESRPGLLLFLGGAFFLAVLLSNCIGLLEIVVTERVSHSLAGSLQLRLFDTYLRADGGVQGRPDTASLATNILQEVYRLTNGIIQGGLVLVSQAAASFFIVCFVVLVDPVVAMAAVLALAAAYLFIYLVVRRRLASYGEEFTRSWHERARLVNEGLGAWKEILLMRNQAFFTRRFAAQTRSIERTQAGIAAISRSPRYILECVTAACLVIAGAWLGRRPDSGNWLVELSLLGIAAYRLLPALQQSFLNVAKIRANRASFQRIAHDLRHARHRVHLADSPPDPAWRDRPRRGIAMREVTLRYDTHRPPALRDLSLEIGAGCFLALVGPNGSGKTTLADVMLGLLRPTEGRVEIDGIALDDTNLASWHSAVAYVPQAPFILNASLAENVALGVARADIDETRLRAALAMASLHELLASLPRGIDEPLGERGANLSGGQRQRVGIARALYRGPSLLVLDEATSALDADAEQSLIEILAGLRGRCTVVLIAHRASSLRLCDRVVELERGTVVQGPRRTRATR